MIGERGLTKEDMIRYDVHIHCHTAHVNTKRKQKIVWKCLHLFRDGADGLADAVEVPNHADGRAVEAENTGVGVIAPVGRRTPIDAELTSAVERRAIA